jgi:hypothetical protein
MSGWRRLDTGDSVKQSGNSVRTQNSIRGVGERMFEKERLCKSTRIAVLEAAYLCRTVTHE